MNGLVDAWRSSLCLFVLLLTISFVRSTVVNLGVVWLKSVLNFISLSDFFAVVFHSAAIGIITGRAVGLRRIVADPSFWDADTHVMALAECFADYGI